MGYNFISEEDTARVFGLTVKGLRKQRYNGEGPAYHKAGKKVFYTEDDIKAFVEDTRIDPRKAGKRAQQTKKDCFELQFKTVLGSKKAIYTLLTQYKQRPFRPQSTRTGRTLL